MAKMRGESLDTRDSSVGSQIPRRSKLPSHAPDIITKHTISVDDPSHILIQHREERRRNFNTLVRRYKHQILYGCENPNCRMPTCLNYQRRVSEGPFRPYTELSARTLACYLASQDNPEKALCRSPPRSTADFSPSRHAPHVEYRTHNAGRKSRQSEYPENDAHTESRRQSSSAGTAPPPLDNVRQSSRDSHLNGISRTKDPKSFAQNLFDTLSLRMVEWLPLRQTISDSSDCTIPTSVRSYKCQSHTGESQHIEATDKTRWTKNHTASNNNPTSETTTHSSRLKRRSTSNLDRISTSQTLKRVTLEETETWRPTARSSSEIKSRDGRSIVPSRTYSHHHIPPPTPALKHRTAKDSKISTDTPTKPPKTTRRVSWDGSKLLRESVELSDGHDETTQKATPDSLSPEVPDLQPPSIQSVPYQVTSVDTVSHLNAEIVDGLSQLLTQNEEDAQKWKEELEYMNIQGKFDNHKWRHATLRQRQVFPFVAQSVFYGLNNSRQLMKSFRRKRPSSRQPRNLTESGTVDLQTLESTLRKLQDICPCDLILNSLWNSLEQLFIPPRDMPIVLRASRRVSYIQPDSLPLDVSQPSTPVEPLSDGDAAHMLTVVLFALITFLPKVDGQTWRGIQQIRELGTVLPDAQMQKLDAKSTALVLDVTDKLEHDLALRLVHRLVRALTARLAFHEISKAKTLANVDFKSKRKKSVLDLLFDNLREHHESLKAQAEPNGQVIAIDTPVAAAMIVEWIRTLFLKEWDGKPEIPRSEAAGGAVQILQFMYKNRERLGLDAEAFYTSFLSERLDAMEMPVEWLSRASNSRTMHLLSFTFLFRPAALVKYFRAINYAAMSKAYEAGMIAQRQASRTAFNRTIQIADEINLLARLHTTMNQYFVVSVRREQVLQDAFDQIWRRERRELLRPLKVKLGTDLGEEGVDLGGVQQEFMTMAFVEAMNPEHGMFTVDPTTRMAWFQPLSPETLEHFELVGILVSLAVYNGLTIPVTFPLALYRKLLDLKVKRVEHIRDGWPDLAKGLDQLLTWTEGDVGDVIMRSYEFSFEAFGVRHTVDMEHTDRDAEWPRHEQLRNQERRRSSVSNYSAEIQKDRASSEEAFEGQADSDIGSFKTGILKGADYNTSLNACTVLADTEESSVVTNANREQYVKDYLFWLTDKSVRPQYEAFARGFFTCIDRSSLALFTPEILQTVIEGTQEIDIEELQRHATYDGGWDENHPLIVAFWNIVKKYSREQKARLLEFVTATDRVPVSGISSINFVIQRNGSGNDRLPTSYTCYGRLLLPEYTNATALGLNLDMALKNSRGFGNF